MSEVNLIAKHFIVRGKRGDVLPGNSFKESADEAEILIAAGAAERAPVAEAPAEKPATKPAKAGKGGKPAPEAELDGEEGDI